MKDKPPLRLLEDPDAPEALRQDLAEASRSRVAYDAAAGLSALKLAIHTGSAAASGTEGAAASTHGGAQSIAGAGGPTAAGESALGQAAGTAGAVASRSALLIKLGATTAGMAALAAVALLLWREPTPTERPGMDAPALPAQAPPPPEPKRAPLDDGLRDDKNAREANEAPTAAPRTPQASPANHAARRRPVPARPRPSLEKKPRNRPAGTPQPRASRVDPDAALQQETAELARIKRLLPKRPQAALALAQAGHARFANGMFYPEREAFSVLALAKLGRAEEARQRGRAFLARYPGSPMRARVEAALADLEAAREAEEGPP